MPPVAILAGMGGELASKADEIKLDSMLQGLSKGLNVETRLNELYSFINNPERAFMVSNLFRQTLLAQSPVVCCILGIILSDCIDNDHTLQYADLIILNSLQTATDFEIKYIKEIINNYVDDGYVDENAIEKSLMATEYYMTLEWCKTNRILGTTGMREINGMTIFSEFLIINTCTERFLDYIERARVFLEYEDSRAQREVQ